MKLTGALLFLMLTAAGGCRYGPAVSPDGPAGSTQSLTISAAVSLKDAFQEIAALYKSRTGVSVTFNFGASGTLQTQIETGAPVDVFASAGQKQMDALGESGLIVTDTRRDFVRNSIVLIVPTDSGSRLDSFEQLSAPSVKRIAAGNPKTVPAGQYAVEVFDSLGIAGSLQPKLILAEDVRQVLDYIIRGEADAGVVYATDARAAGDKVRVVATASESSHEPIRYPIAVVKGSRQQEAARNFIEFILSGEGQSILMRYGFLAAVEN